MLWQVETTNKEIYLTFDDGPVPEVTEWVLDELAKWAAKATFFVVGENVKNNAEIFNKIVSAEHAIGNHTYHHLNGWTTKLTEYMESISLCDETIAKAGSNLFRPPYGKISLKQAKKVAKTHKIVMWDVLSGDFDPGISPQGSLKKTIEATRNGSIVLFHDNVKTVELVKHVLPDYLAHFSSLGYKFKSLPK